MKKKKFFLIQGSKPGGTYRDNVNLKIISYDLESAIKLAKKNSPEVEISQITLKEKIDIIDPLIVLDMFNSEPEEDK